MADDDNLPDQLNTSLDYISYAAGTIEDATGFGSWIRNRNIGPVIFAITSSIVGGIIAAGDTFFGALSAIGGGLSALIEGTFGAGVGVIDAGGAAAVASFASGWAAAFGPLAFPAGVAAAGLGVLVLVWFWNYISPLDWISGLTRE